MSRILVIGTGAWGTALANTLLINKHTVCMYGVNQIEINDLKAGYNKKYFNETKMFKPPYLVSNKLDMLFENQYDFILLAVPSVALKSACKNLVPFITNKPIIINCVKGLDDQTNHPLSESIEKILTKTSGVVSLAGPSFAKEVMNKAVTFVNVTSKRKDVAKKVTKLFNNDFFHCAYCKNELSVQYMSALKNIMAIIFGLMNQQNISINTKSAFFTLALNEMISVMGKSHEEIFNFSGIGDLYLTCNDPQSRNYKFGMLLGEVGGKRALVENKVTVEGLSALKSTCKIINKKKLDCPLTKCLYNVIYKNHSVKDFVVSVVKALK